MKSGNAFLVAVSTLALGLSACGGGGVSGGGSASSPAPVPTPTNANLYTLTVSQKFAGKTVYISGKMDPFNGRTKAVTGSGSQVGSITYNANDQSWTVNAIEGDKTFTLSDKRAAKSNNIYTVYERGTSSDQETLILFNPGPGNPTMALNYTSYAGWLGMRGTSDPIDARIAFISYGIGTAAKDMPKSGAASYKTMVDGFWLDASGTYALGGTSTFAADFAAGKVNTSMNLFGDPIFSGPNVTIGTFSGTADIVKDSNSFSASYSQVPSGWSGQFMGSFYGPTAEEVGLTFELASVTGRVTGVVVGKKN